MFTKGITKIFRLTSYGHFDNLVEKAKHSKELAFSHNGVIYVFDYKGDPVKTPFTVDDFEVSFFPNKQ